MDMSTGLFRSNQNQVLQQEQVEKQKKSCESGEAEYKYRHVEPGVNDTWVLSNSTDTNQVFSVVFGELGRGGGAENQFQFCQTNSDKSVDCSIPSTWRPDMVSTEHFLVPMHKLRPVCMPEFEQHNLTLKNCNGDISFGLKKLS